MNDTKGVKLTTIPQKIHRVPVKVHLQMIPLRELKTKKELQVPVIIPSRILQLLKKNQTEDNANHDSEDNVDVYYG